MKNITKLKRSIRAISPVISVLLMIAVAVVASLVAYAWVMGYIGFQAQNTGQAIQIPSYAPGADSSHMKVYVQNVGQGAVTIGNVYINSALANIDSPLPGNLGLAQGETKELTVALPTGVTWTAGQQVGIKVTTTSGTFMEVSGTGSSGGSGGPSHGAVTSILVSPDPASVASGATIAFTAMASDGSTSWDVSTLATWSVNPTSAGTFSGNVLTATTVGASYTVTAQYSGFSDTAPLTVTAGTVTSITVSPDSASVASGATQTYTASASDGTNNWDVSTSASWSVTPTAGGTFSGNVLTAGTVGTSYTVTAQYSGVSDTASLSVTSAIPTKLVFTVKPSNTVEDYYSLFTVQRQTASGTPTTIGALTVSLSDANNNDGSFYATSSGGPTITTVTIPQGSSSIDFYYRYTRNAPATVSITAASQGVTPALTSATATLQVINPTTLTLSPTTSGTTGWTNPTNAYADGGNYASSSANNEAQTYSGYTSTTIPSGAVITSVEVRADAWTSSGGYNDNMKLEASTDGGTTYITTTSTFNLPFSEPNWQTQDITSWASWTAANVNGITLRVTHVADGSVDQIRLDWIPITVIYFVP